MSAAATPYCSACMLRLTGLRSQERAKRTHRMPVWRRCDAPFALASPASLFPDRSDRFSQNTARHRWCLAPRLSFRHALLNLALPDAFFQRAAHQCQVTWYGPCQKVAATPATSLLGRVAPMPFSSSALGKGIHICGCMRAKGTWGAAVG